MPGTPLTRLGSAPSICAQRRGLTCLYAAAASVSIRADTYGTTAPRAIHSALGAQCGPRPPPRGGASRFGLRHVHRPFQPYDRLRWPVDAQPAYRQGAEHPSTVRSFPLSAPGTSTTTTTTARPPPTSTDSTSCNASAPSESDPSCPSSCPPNTARRSVSYRKCADGLGDPVRAPPGIRITGAPGASQFGTVRAPLDTHGASAGRRAPTVLYANETPLRRVRSVLVWPDPAASSVDSRAHGHRCAGSTGRLG